MTRPPDAYRKYVSVAGRCPHCNSEIVITLTKQEVKKLYRGMRLPVEAANVLAETENKKMAKRND